MKVIIRDIPKDGMELLENILPSSIGLLDSELKSLTPLLIRARINLVENIVLADVCISGRFGFSCSRCLDPIEQQENVRFDLDYPVEKGMEFIDLSEDIRQEAILRLIPTRVLCADNCQGICAGCGVNLNKESCQCQST